jgi:hypothetical protein
VFYVALTHGRLYHDGTHLKQCRLNLFECCRTGMPCQGTQHKHPTRTHYTDSEPTSGALECRRLKFTTSCTKAQWPYLVDREHRKFWKVATIFQAGCSPGVFPNGKMDTTGISRAPLVTAGWFESGRWLPLIKWLGCQWPGVTQWFYGWNWFFSTIIHWIVADMI